MSDVTRVLEAIQQGDPRAAAQLLPLVYEELRNLAAHRLAQEAPGQTLQATALVHEAYVRLVDSDHPQDWDSRGHFFAAAAEAMRRIMIEAARRKRSEKHGGGRERVELSLDVADPGQDAERALDLLGLDDALTKLETLDPPAAQLVKLRYFAGLTIPDAARVLGVSPRKADLFWSFARTWLFRELRDEA
jgi:RNA polymerase sigma factor (TIGR02999 family)